MREHSNHRPELPRQPRHAWSTGPPLHRTPASHALLGHAYTCLQLTLLAILILFVICCPSQYEYRVLLDLIQQGHPNAAKKVRAALHVALTSSIRCWGHARERPRVGRLLSPTG